MLDRFHKIAEIIASIAIVASLIFVGIQVSQNTEALETNAAQINSQSWQDITLAVATNSQLAAAYRESFSENFRNSSVQSVEALQVGNLIHAQLKSMEFNYLQWRDGKLSDEIFAPTRAGYLFTLANNPRFEQIVMTNGSPFTASFKDFSRKVVAEAKQLRAAMEETAER